MHEIMLPTPEGTPSTPEYTLSRVSDAVLLRDLTALVAKDRHTTARILAHIAEVDARRLYAPAGYPSMFAFCVEELRLSEDAAYKRLQAARAARSFPELFAAVAEGRLHLTAVCRLAPHLTVENAEELIQAATHRSKSEVEAMLARRFPGSPAPVRVVQAISGPLHSQLVPEPVEEAGAGDLQLVPEQAGGTALVPAALPPPEHYLLQLAIGKATHEKLRYAQALLSHAVPSGDLAAVLDRALDALIGQLEGRRFGAGARARGDGNGRGSHPRSAGAGSAGVRSAGPRAAGVRSAGAGVASAGKRYIPARIRRAVWERDGGRCTFVSARGHRCEARRFLQYDHVVPVARGGTATVEGLRLLCRAHNQYEADRVFGAGFMRRKRPETRLAAAGTLERSALAGNRTALTREQAAPPQVGAQEEHADLLAGLRSLGCRGEMARRAAESAQSLGGITLEERLRAALQFIGRSAVRGAARRPADTAGASHPG